MSWIARLSAWTNEVSQPDFASTGITALKITQNNPASSDEYPTTRNGLTFGIEAGSANGILGRSINAAITEPFKFSWRVYRDNQSYANFLRLDLPQAGTYEIAFANGRLNATSSFGWYISDGASVLHTVPVAATSGNYTNTRDANGVLKTFAQWLSDPGWVQVTTTNSYLLAYPSTTTEAWWSAFYARAITTPNTRRRRYAGGYGL